MTNRILASAILAFGVTQPQFADALTVRNGVRVNQVNSAVFEAVPRSSGNGMILWCAASEYARRALNASWQTEIYVARGMGPSETTNRRSAVQFTIDPNAAGVTPIDGSHSLNSFKVGDHMSVQRANGFCEEQPVW